MPRKALRHAPPPAQTYYIGRTGGPPAAWTGYLITALLAAALAAAGVWLAVVRPSLHAAAHAAPPSVSGASLVSAGNAAFDRKDWATAATDYSEAIAAGQDNPDVRTDLGTTYRSLHEPQKAVEEYAVAQREDPNHQNSLVNEGIVYAFDLRNTSAAMSAWHRYLQRFPHGEHVADVKRLMALAASPLPQASQEKP